MKASSSPDPVGAVQIGLNPDNSNTWVFTGSGCTIVYRIINNEHNTEDVLLGYGNIDGVLESDGYFNTIVGRVANRIGSSKFNIDDNEYQLYSNVAPNHLHGGKVGFNKKIWKIENIEESKNLYQMYNEILFTGHGRKLSW